LALFVNENGGVFLEDMLVAISNDEEERIRGMMMMPT
jgi:hypothetical protein